MEGNSKLGLWVHSWPSPGWVCKGVLASAEAKGGGSAQAQEILGAAPETPKEPLGALGMEQGPATPGTCHTWDLQGAGNKEKTEKNEENERKREKKMMF